MQDVDESQIVGYVDIRDNLISVDEFTDKFIQWIESNGWYYGEGINTNKQDK
jgi:hypothetical protein